MRVLYFIDSIAPGGAGRSLVAVAPHLVSKGVDLEVAYLVDREPNLREQLQEAGVRVVGVGGSSRVQWLIQATRLVRSRSPDIVHTTLFEADLAGRVAGLLGGAPVVSSLVNLAYGPEQLRDNRLSRWKVEGARLLDAVSCRIPVRFHAVTREVAQVMGRRLRISKERIDVVPRGRDLAALGTRSPRRRMETRRAAGVGTRELVVLAVGRQEYQKGFDVLLEAFRMVLIDLPNARLFLCGRRGAASRDLDQQADGIRQRVTFLGPRDDVPDLLCAADLVVLPSRWEGIGGVLLEAMALETPIIASDLPALREVLDDGECGRLVPVDQPQALSRAIVGALSGDRETMARVQMGRRRFEQVYTADRVAGQMLRFYELAARPSMDGSVRSSPIRRPDRSMTPIPMTVATRMDKLLVQSPAQAVFHRRYERSLAVLAYHGIADPDSFSRQLDYLERNSHPVSLADALAALAGRTGLPRHAVLITFDDADRSLLDHGVPALRERGFPAVAFVIAGHLNGHKPFWWVEVEDLVLAGGRVPGLEGLPPDGVIRGLKRIPEDRRRAAIDELRITSPRAPRDQPQLKQEDLSGLEAASIVIGNHTMTHPSLPRCSHKQVDREIRDAHEILKDAVGTAPDVFAYPNGDWDPRAEPVLAELGYETGFLYDHALARPPARNRFRISRLRVDSTTSIERLGLVLSGLHPAIHRVRTRMNGGVSHDR
jgi:glycosyltransferase involved in cell wall biosynthesis/peptidoglycan/xylan/chitin deacetylase (PgdA/CDA1 family)